MAALIWFNDDGLNSEHPMLQDHPNAPKIYVFDEVYLQQWTISMHRVQFIYESLLEIPDIQIYKGDTVQVLQQLIADYQAERVVTTATPNHSIKAWQQEIQKYVELVLYPEEFPVNETRSPRRFSAYWRKQERSWLRA